MSTPARKPKGAPAATGGQFDGRGTRTTAGNLQGLTTAHFDIYDNETLNTMCIPDKADRAHVREISKAEIQWSLEGRGKKWEELDAVIEAHPAFLEVEERFAEARARKTAAVRAFKAGIPHPADTWYEKQWTNPEGGIHSETGTITELARLQQIKADYRAGIIGPSKIVGTGLKNPHKIAREYLVDREAELNEAILTRGRSYLNAPTTVLHVRGENSNKIEK